MTTRRRASSGDPNETAYGYVRAVRAGDLVFVSGTTARGAALDGDTGAQLRDAIVTVDMALREVGATLADVVRTVVYVRAMEDEALVAEIHREAFGAHPPASTLVEVSRLSPDAARVEIEVTAALDWL